MSSIFDQRDAALRIDGSRIRFTGVDHLGVPHEHLFEGQNALMEAVLAFRVAQGDADAWQEATLHAWDTRNTLKLLAVHPST